MTHKIVAFRITGLPDGVKIDALTASPRGTKAFVGTRSVSADHTDKKVFAAAVEAAVKELIASTR